MINYAPLRPLRCHYPAGGSVFERLLNSLVIKTGPGIFALMISARGIIPNAHQPPQDARIIYAAGEANELVDVILFIFCLQIPYRRAAEM